MQETIDALSSGEAAAILGITRPTVRSRARRLGVGAIVGRRLIVPRSALPLLKIPLPAGPPKGWRKSRATT